MPSNNIKLEVAAVGGWKEAYFCDRGPRITCRLTHPPGTDSTSIPITIRTQTRSGTSSMPLIVKQELQGNSMKNWQHVFTIRSSKKAMSAPAAAAAKRDQGRAPELAQLLVKAKTRKNMEEWISSLNNPRTEARRFAGVLWLKPSEERRHFTLTGDILYMRNAETTPVVASWTVKAPSSDAPADACAHQVGAGLVLVLGWFGWVVTGLACVRARVCVREWGWG